MRVQAPWVGIVGGLVLYCGCGSPSSGVPSGESSSGSRASASSGTPDGTAPSPGSGQDAASGADGTRPDAANGPDSSGADGTAEASAPTGPWVMGYYSGWDASDLPVSAIEWSGLTHIATAFMIPSGGGFTSASDPTNPSFDPALAASVIAAAHGAGKKAIASIGGADSATAFEGSMSNANRGSFLASVAALVTTTGYDGVDIDWEGGPSSDDALILDLVQRLRAALPSAILTMTAGSINSNIVPTDIGTLFAAAAPSVDRINLMTYGMSGAYSGWKSWHSSPLHWNHDGATPTGIDDTVARYVAAGVPAEKLGVGSGFYGECYTSPVTGPDEALGGSTVIASDGVMSYRAIMSDYFSAGARQWDTTAMVPYLTLAGTNAQGCTYITYEDAQSIAAKGAWVKAQGLGGVILWTINEGYLPNAAVGARNPLLEATRASFL